MYSAARPFSSKTYRVRSTLQKSAFAVEIPLHAFSYAGPSRSLALSKRANSWLRHPHARNVTSVDHS
jgi:hypothetical protein